MSRPLEKNTPLSLISCLASCVAAEVAQNLCVEYQTAAPYYRTHGFSRFEERGPTKTMLAAPEETASRSPVTSRARACRRTPGPLCTGPKGSSPPPDVSLSRLPPTSSSPSNLRCLRSRPKPNAAKGLKRPVKIWGGCSGACGLDGGGAGGKGGVLGGDGGLGGHDGGDGGEDGLHGYMWCRNGVHGRTGRPSDALPQGHRWAPGPKGPGYGALGPGDHLGGLGGGATHCFLFSVGVGGGAPPGDSPGAP